MQKFLKFFMLLLVAVVLIGCGGEGNKINKKDYFTVINNAKQLYSESASGNIYIEIVNGDVALTTEFIYNFNGNKIDTLKHVLNSEEVKYEAYVSEGVAYVNDNGVKTKGNIFDMESEQVIRDYGFTGVTEEVFKTFDKAFVKALVLSKDEKGVATLNYDATKYQLDVEGLEGTDLDDAIDRHTNITANIKSVEVKITYENDIMTKLESTWTNNNNKVSKINIELRGTGKQTIEFPNFNDYIKR